MVTIWLYMMNIWLMMVNDDDDEWLIMGSIRVNDDDFHGFV